jgi:hypothetical protein
MELNKCSYLAIDTKQNLCNAKYAHAQLGTRLGIQMLLLPNAIPYLPAGMCCRLC